MKSSSRTTVCQCKKHNECDDKKEKKLKQNNQKRKKKEQKIQTDLTRCPENCLCPSLAKEKQKTQTDITRLYIKENGLCPSLSKEKQDRKNEWQKEGQKHVREKKGQDQNCRECSDGENSNQKVQKICNCEKKERDKNDREKTRRDRNDSEKWDCEKKEREKRDRKRKKLVICENRTRTDITAIEGTFYKVQIYKPLRIIRIIETILCMVCIIVAVFLFFVGVESFVWLLFPIFAVPFAFLILTIIDHATRAWYQPINWHIWICVCAAAVILYSLCVGLTIATPLWFLLILIIPFALAAIIYFMDLLLCLLLLKRSRVGDVETVICTHRRKWATTTGKRKSVCINVGTKMSNNQSSQESERDVTTHPSTSSICIPQIVCKRIQSNNENETDSNVSCVKKSQSLPSSAAESSDGNYIVCCPYIRPTPRKCERRSQKY